MLFAGCWSGLLRVARRLSDGPEERWWQCGVVAGGEEGYQETDGVGVSERGRLFLQ